MVTQNKFNSSRQYSYIFLLAAAFILSSCFGGSNFKKINEGFEYGFVNTDVSSNIYYGDQGIFSECCFSIQWDSRYIIAMTHPYDSVTAPELNKKITHYFVIDCPQYRKDPNQEKSSGVKGPMDGVSFEKYIADEKINLASFKSYTNDVIK